jgi:hypothetical protein
MNVGLLIFEVTTLPNKIDWQTGISRRGSKTATGYSFPACLPVLGWKCGAMARLAAAGRQS